MSKGDYIPLKRKRNKEQTSLGDCLKGIFGCALYVTALFAVTFFCQDVTEHTSQLKLDLPFFPMNRLILHIFKTDYVVVLSQRVNDVTVPCLDSHYVYKNPGSVDTAHITRTYFSKVQ